MGVFSRATKLGPREGNGGRMKRMKRKKRKRRKEKEKEEEEKEEKEAKFLAIRVLLALRVHLWELFM